MNSLLIIYSYHHKNTEKIAKVIAKVLDAQIKTPQQVNPEEVQEYELVGFGSGIYGAKPHKSLFDLADKLPNVNNKKAFIFSTSALTNRKKVAKDHSLLYRIWIRTILRERDLVADMCQVCAQKPWTNVATRV